MPGRGQVAVRVEVRPHLLCAALLVCCDSCHSHAALLCAVIGLHPVPRLSQEAFTGYLEPCLCPCGLLLRPCMCPLMMTLVRHAFAGLCRRQVHTIAHTLQDPHGILCSLECRAACACKYMHRCP